MNKLVSALIIGFFATAAHAADSSVATPDANAIGATSASTTHEAAASEAGAASKQKKAAPTHHHHSKKKDKKASKSAEKKSGENAAQADATQAQNPAAE